MGTRAGSDPPAGRRSLDRPPSTRPRAGATFGRWSVIAGGSIAVAIGSLYFVAWQLGLPARWAAGGVIVMKTNMALGQVLAGSSLLLLRAGGHARARVLAARLAAGVVLAIGALTLAEYALGLDLGIDQLLATEPASIRQTLAPNRMGLPGATSLTLLGAGLLALSARRRLHVWLGVATSAVIVFPAVGFVYGIGQLYANATVTVIAWPTVIALLALGLGLALSDGGDGTVPLLWRADDGGRLLRRMLAPAVLLPLVIGFVRIVGERRGLYERYVGTGLFAVSSSALCLFLIWRSAAQVSASAGQRDRAEDVARWRASLLQLSTDAVLVWSPGGGIETWNHGAEELYGFSEAEALGRASHALLRTRFPRPWPEIEEALARGGRWEGELVHTTKRGDEVVVLSAMQTVRGVDGALRVFESNKDVTGRKRMESELQAANERLREADRRKDEFLGMLSHELRNPLAPVRTSLHILDQVDPTSAQARRAREVAGRQIAHLARLVDDLLDVTRIGRGKIQLRRAALDVAAVARRTAEDLSHLMTDRGVQLTVNVPRSRLVVNGDETRLAQVVGNLLTNAAKFTPTGGRVTVDVEQDGGSAVLRVRDTGAGIERALLERIFEPFTQAAQTLARSEGGLGLGLALVKGLIEQHGGTVSVASEGPGRGSEFTVRIPLAAAIGDAEEAERPAPTPPGRRLRVLVVDDNQDAAETLADLVRMFGHDVEVAYDGASALEKADAIRPDVILCDLGLPGMSGYEVARALRRRGDGQVRLVAVSGYAQPDDVSRSVEAGFDAHLAKPPDPAEIDRAIRAAARGEQPSLRLA